MSDDITCAEFEQLSEKQRLAVAALWRDHHPQLVGNPMYASMSSSEQASYMMMSFDAYCSQAEHAEDNLGDLTM